MVTTASARPTFSSLPGGQAITLAFNWRRSELLWPDLPARCGLDAPAARLLRYHLTLAVEQMLEARCERGAPLPPRCDVGQVGQPRFDPLGVQWRQRKEDLRALLETEVQQTLALARRPLGGQDGGVWARALVEQCARVGWLYRGLVRRVGQAHALAALAAALDVFKNDDGGSSSD